MVRAAREPFAMAAEPKRHLRQAQRSEEQQHTTPLSSDPFSHPHSEDAHRPFITFSDPLPLRSVGVLAPLHSFLGRNVCSDPEV